MVDTISTAYRAAGCPLLAGLRCHSTQGISTSWAALKAVSVEDICAVASWASLSTFQHFHSLDFTCVYLVWLCTPGSQASKAYLGGIICDTVFSCSSYAPPLVVSRDKIERELQL